MEGMIGYLARVEAAVDRRRVAVNVESVELEENAVFVLPLLLLLLLPARTHRPDITTYYYNIQYSIQAGNATNKK